MRTRLVLFDIDGTLIRTGGAGVKAFAQTAEHLFGRPGGTERLRFHGRTDLSLVREFFRLQDLPDSPVEVERFLTAYLHFLDEQLSRHRGEICPGVGALIQALRQVPDPPKIGLLTGNVRLGAHLKLSAHGLADEFEFGAFGDDHENRNELARIALAKARQKWPGSWSGSEVLVVGDTPADIECARAIDAHCLAVATGGSALAELLEHSPTLAVESLDDLAVERLLHPGERADRITDWESLYQAGDTRWDKGEAAPGLVDFLASQTGVRGQSVLVPGCGRGHDARAWARAGAKVVACDLSPQAIVEAQTFPLDGGSIVFETGDFLSKKTESRRFDWVFEHTLFCAIAPSQRGDYVRSIKEAVAPGGHFLAIHYLQPQDPSGPPFGVTVSELRQRFETDFDLVDHWLPRSFPGRDGRERMFLWRRRR